LAPLLAILIYPTAKWLFAFVLIGIAVLVLNHLFAKDIRPQDLADRIERLLTGNYGGWDVGDFENLGKGHFWKSARSGALPVTSVNVKKTNPRYTSPLKWPTRRKTSLREASLGSLRLDVLGGREAEMEMENFIHFSHEVAA
jgi:hypothetical protein